MRPILCSRCQKDGHNHRTCNAISYSQFGQAKGIIFQYSVHLSMILSTFLALCPHFRVYVHILEYLSTFRNICSNFRIYVHISEYMSTFPSKRPHFENMSTLWNICHFPLIIIQRLYFDTNLCLVQVTEETLQIRPSVVTKKRRGRNKTRRINNQFVTRPIVCSRCRNDGHNCHTWNTGIDEEIMDPAVVDEDFNNPT